ncbi:MAG: hypothetical protein ACPG31_05455 [Planctomycetota bacterium]
MVSTDSQGSYLAAGGARPSLSSDGKVLAFQSEGRAYHPGDSTWNSDIFVKDLVSGQLIRASEPILAVGGGDSQSPVLSGDGNVVVFESDAKNLFLNDLSQGTQIVAHDLTTGVTTPISISSTGIPADANCVSPSISRDGRFVAFASESNLLASNDLNQSWDVFLHDRQTGITELISKAQRGTAAGNSSSPSISGDGRFIAYHSYAENIAPGDSNGHGDVLLFDRQTSHHSLVSRASSGLQANNLSTEPAISDDGRYVFFSSWAGNLVPNDHNGWQDIFRHEIATGNLIRASIDRWGTSPNQPCVSPTPNADGSKVFFVTEATDLITPSDIVGTEDVYCHTIASGENQLVTAPNHVRLATPSQRRFFAVDATGEMTVFESSPSNFDPSRAITTSEIYLRDSSGPSLRIEGDCPGTLTLTLYGGTIGQPTALLFGPAGSFVQPNGPCQGLTVDISNPTFAGFAIPGGDTLATWSTTLPSAACGLTVQAVDLTKCSVTNPMQL